MKGLEISEIKKSELNLEFRIDAEYFSKSYIERRKILESFGTVTIGDCVTDGIHTSIDYDEDSPVNLLSATSPRDNYVDLSRGAKISVSAHNANPRTAVRTGDVLVSTVGTIGNSAVVDESILPANTDRHIGIIRKPNYSPYLISTFLLSRFGMGQTLREATGNVQQNLFLYKIREILLPKFSKRFQAQVESIVKNGYSKRIQASKIYNEVADVLLSELGLADYTPTDESVSVRKFSDFMAARRLDAEYYQPKYDEMIQKILCYDCNAKPLSGFVSQVKNNYKACSGVSVDYIEIGDVDVTTGECTRTRVDVADLPANAKIRIFGGELLVSLVRPTRGAIAIAPMKSDVNQVCSGAFFVANVGTVELRDTLWLYLRCIRNLFEKYCVGTSYPTIDDDVVSGILVPNFGLMLQKKISLMVQRSFAARKESARLLDLAKLAVETAIEKGEDEGLRILEA